MNKQDLFTYAISSLGVAFSIQNINDILNLILLIVSIINIIIVFGLRMYDAIKEKNIDKVNEATKEFVNKINDLKDKDYEDK